MARRSPTVRRRRLSIELRRLRENADLTAAEAARRIGWNASKITRIERCEWRLPNHADVIRLLDLYEMTDTCRREELIGLVKDARRRGWWHDYRVSEAYSTYVGLETEAKVIRNYEPLAVPGLLQTPAYARALITGRAPGLEEDALADRVELRMERQRLLEGSSPVTLWAILDEAVLRRIVGGAAVMAEQMEHLYSVAALDNVTVQVVPFDADVQPGHGPFAILTFQEPVDPETVYVETTAGELWVEDPDGVAEIKATFERLIGAGLTVRDSLAMINTAAVKLRGGRNEGSSVAQGEQK